MSGTKLSSLAGASPLSLSDLFYAVQTPGVGGTKATLAQLETLFSASFLGLSGGTLTGSLTLGGNISAAAWTTAGIKLKGGGSTLTDTTSSGTVALAVTNKLGGNTIAASSATTYTDYGTLYLDVPAAGTNVTITNPWSLIASGAMKSTALTLTGGTLTLNGATSGASVLSAPAVAGSATITLPGVTSTLATLGANTFTSTQTIPSLTYQRPSDNSSFNWLSLTAPAGRTHEAPFQIYVGGATFSSEWDPVMYFGYNADRSNATEPAFRWVIEGNYNTGSERDIEAYWEYVDTAAHAWRPIFVYRDKASVTTGGETLVLNNEYLYLQGTRAAPLTFTLKPQNANQPAQIWVQGLGTGNNTNQFLKIAGGSSDSSAAFIRLGGNTCTTGEMGGGNYAEGLLQLGAGAPSTHTAGTTAGTIVMLVGATPTEYFRLQYDGKVVLNNPGVAASYQLDVNGSIGGGQIAADVLSAGGYRFKGHTTKGMYLQTTNLGAGSNVLVLQSANGIDVGIGGGTFRLKSSIGFGFSSGGPDDSNGDTLLYRDAAGTLAQRNSTNAQTLRVYNTYTDASNYERVGLSWGSNICTLDTAAAGTGTLRGLLIGGATTSKIGFWGATSVVQPASANQAAVSDTAGATYTSAEQTMLANLKTLVNQIRADLVTVGLIKGAA